MQWRDRTIVGGLLQLNGIAVAALLNSPGHNKNMVAEVRGDGAGDGDAVVEHHMGVVHDDVLCRVGLLYSCKENKDKTKEKELKDPVSNSNLAAITLRVQVP